MSDKIKTLSDAIELGATFRPQCVGRYFHAGRSCALFAAAEATWGNEKAKEKANNYELKSALAKRFNVPMIFIHDIPIWNDDDELTREQIAEKLREIGY